MGAFQSAIPLALWMLRLHVLHIISKTHIFSSCVAGPSPNSALLCKYVEARSPLTLNFPSLLLHSPILHIISLIPFAASFTCLIPNIQHTHPLIVCGYTLPKLCPSLQIYFGEISLEFPIQCSSPYHCIHVRVVKPLYRSHSALWAQYIKRLGNVLTLADALVTVLVGAPIPRHGANNNFVAD